MTKRLIFCVFVALILTSSVIAEQESTFHYPFGIKDGMRNEEIYEVLQKNMGWSKFDESEQYSLFIPGNQRLFNLRLGSVMYLKNEKLIAIALNEEKTAYNLQIIYNAISEVFGEPTHESITTQIMTVNGVEKKEIAINETQLIQQAILDKNISCIIWWSNIRVTLTVKKWYYEESQMWFDDSNFSLSFILDPTTLEQLMK